MSTNIQKIQSLIDETFDEELEANEIRFDDLKKTYQGKLNSRALLHRIDKLVELGKVSKRKDWRGNLIIKLL